MANERGGDDNITVIVLKVVSVGPQKCGFWKWLSDIFNW
jgi:serine/threonine protein phosphatase PrpC